MRRVEHVVSTWRLKLVFERALVIVNPHRGITESSPVDGVINRLPFFEIKRLDAFAFEGFPESASE